jgi:hypothetical protein
MPKRKIFKIMERQDSIDRVRVLIHVNACLRQRAGLNGENEIALGSFRF